MPELVFKGKEYVYNHHLTVPYRPLIAHADKSVGPADLHGNLIIYGDNLHALKSLLPRYAGKVDLVFIDPPYNTGNEKLELQRQRQLADHARVAPIQSGECGRHAASRQVVVHDVAAAGAVAGIAVRAGQFVDDAR